MVSTDTGVALMDPVDYKGFEVMAVSKPTQDGSGWTVEVHITNLNGPHGGPRGRRYTTDKVIADRGAAELESIKFGKEVIDGKHPGLSVDDL